MTKYETISDPSLPPGIDEDIPGPPKGSPPERRLPVYTSNEDLPIIVDVETGTLVTKPPKEKKLDPPGDNYDEPVETDGSSVESERNSKQETEKEALSKDEPNGSNSLAAVSALPGTRKPRTRSVSKNTNLFVETKSPDRAQSGTKNTDPVKESEESFQNEYAPHQKLHTTPPKAKEMKIQPTTPETVASDISTPPTSPIKSNKNDKNDGRATTIVIDNRAGKKSRSPVVGFFMAHKKKILIVVIIWIILATGAAAYMFPGFLSIPGLDAQIKELEREVDRLEVSVNKFSMENDRLENNIDLLTGEVDRLEHEVDRLQSEVGRLASEVDRLQGSVDGLNGTITRLEETNADLEDNIDDLVVANVFFQNQTFQLELSNEEYRGLNLELQNANAEYKENNENLNSSVAELKDQVSELKDTEQSLTNTIDEYRTRNEELSSEVDNLSNITLTLDGQIDDLDEQVASLQEQNANYAQLNEDLGTVVSFLNNTSLGVDQTYEALTASLAEQITTRRNLLVQDTQLKYQATALHWDCDIDTQFLLRDFVRNQLDPLGADDYNDVMVYLEEELLGEVCIDRQDLESFFLSNVLDPDEDLSSMSLADVKAGVSEYTTLTFDYYFPDAGEVGGLSESDWGEASYVCDNLPAEKRFTVSNS